MSWDKIPGWTDEHLLAAYDAAIEAAPDGSVFVEVGVAFGRSIAYAATTVLQSGKRIELVAVDSWKITHWLEEDFTALIVKHGGAFEAFIGCLEEHCPEAVDLIDPWKGTSLEAAEAFAGGISEAPRFVFIDGAHDEESVYADVAAWAPLVAHGGAIAGHDHIEAHPGVERAVRRYFGDTYSTRGSCWWRDMP